MGQVLGKQPCTHSQGFLNLSPFTVIDGGGAVGRNDSMASSAGERATQIVSQVLRIIQLHRVGQATIGKVAVEQAICRNLRKRRTILRKGEGRHMKLNVPAGEC